VNVVFGLDNVEEPLIWQRFIAQSMLAMKQTDPSFSATYPATLAGASIWWVPVLEYEAGAAAQTEKKYRG